MAWKDIRADRGSARSAVAISIALAVGAFAVASAVSSGPARGPIASRNPDAAAPVESLARGIRFVFATTAPEHLLIDSIAPTRRARLLFFEGEVAQPAPSGGVLTLDGAGGILLVDDRLRVRRIPVGTDGRDIVSVAPAADRGLWMVSGQGEVLRVDRAGELVSVVSGSFDYSLVASGPDGTAWLVRSPIQQAFRPVFGSTPLLARLDAEGNLDGVVASGVVPRDFLLSHLASAGRIAVTDSVIFYAPFIRDEVIALSLTGDTLWVSSRGLPHSTKEPRFEVIEGDAVIDYAPVNSGLALGPDGRLYVLSVPGFTTAQSRLDVFDPQSGHLLRTALLASPLPTLAADDEGRVYLLDEFALLTGVPPEERTLLQAFDLELMNGAGRVTSEEVHGKVVLINFWASWCLPCREEMPALDTLRRSITDHDFLFLTFNEDVSERPARQFIAEFGFDFPVAMGRGDLRERYHYVGLPFTILADREGKVVQRWIGFAGEEQLLGIRSVVIAELERGRDADMDMSMMGH